jgi:hypothetical protein
MISFMTTQPKNDFFHDSPVAKWAAKETCVFTIRKYIIVDGESYPMVLGYNHNKALTKRLLLIPQEQ